ncbi:MAG: nicotinate (nicotinamide) nucleotide adenylyltransferase [Bdellovibrionota bacterium]|nr:MAG: nicotinate (nicotinamide) nucleotide adenylyltransferase [Bdellovibrionota bacterium]
MAKTVALYGGNFDPPHNGHLTFITQLLAEPGIDEVWVLPSGPLRSKSAEAPVLDRVRMLEACVGIAFGTDPRVRLNYTFIEQKVPDESTFLLIQYLKERHPECEFHFAIGSELIADLPSWKYPQELKRSVSFLVYMRLGSDAKDFLPGYRLRPLQSHNEELVFISSSKIRALLAQNRSVSGLIPESVFHYILGQELYGQRLPNRDRLIGRGRFLELRDRRGWEFVHRSTGSNVVAIVAITDQQKVVLVEQFRPALGGPVIELPAGLIGDDGDSTESAQSAAERELLEETGFTAQSWDPICHGPPVAGLADEVVTMFLARGLRQCAVGGGVGHERITVHEVPLAELVAWLAAKARSGCAIDPKIYAGAFFAASVQKQGQL